MMAVGFKKQLGVTVCLAIAFLTFSSQAAFAQNNNYKTASVVPLPQTPEQIPVNPTPWELNPPQEDSPLDSVTIASPILPPEILQLPPANDLPMDDLDKLEESVPVAGETLQNWASERNDSAHELIQMRAEVLDKLEIAVKTLDEAKVVDKIKKGSIKTVRPGLGRMKITLLKQDTIVNGKTVEKEVPTTVFFDNKTGVATILYDKGELDPESRQFRSMVAGFHIEGGKKGRDVARGEINIHGEVDTTYIPRPKFSDWKEWGKDRYYYYRRDPDKNDVVVGVGTGIVYAAATAGTSAAISVIGTKLFNHPTPFEWAPTITSLGFTTVLGIYNRFYSNLTTNTRLTPAQQGRRQYPVTMIFNSIYLLCTGGFQAEHFLSLNFQAENLVQIQVNKRFVSTPVNRSWALRTDLRQNAGRWRFSVFKKNFALRHDTIEKGIIGLAPLTFKNIDFILRKFVTFHAFGHSYHPVLPFFQLFGAAAFSVGFLVHKRILANREVSEEWPEHQSLAMKELYENSFIPRLWTVTKNDPRAVLPFIKDAAVESLGNKVDVIKVSCSKILTTLRLKGPLEAISIVPHARQE
jgi:hypothetical protein